jgi:hypothetical protein
LGDVALSLAAWSGLIGTASLSARNSGPEPAMLLSPFRSGRVAHGVAISQLRRACVCADALAQTILDRGGRAELLDIWAAVRENFEQTL